MLGGLQWAGLAAVAEALGINDIERLIHQLMAIQNFQNKAPDNGE